MMNIEAQTEIIRCPLCNEQDSEFWAQENGFTAVKCSDCGLVYVNPRPVQSLISEAVQTGVHSNVEHGRKAINRRAGSKVSVYKRILAAMFNDVWSDGKEISWLDVGAGYGEVVEAVSKLAPPGSNIIGIEPMRPKAEHAQDRGLKIKEGYLSDIKEKFDFVSLINVFSHIPDFHKFLADLKIVMTRNGELFLETGNIGDFVSCNDVPTELDLPDHLVFTGEKNIEKFLSEAGFRVIEIKKMRKDGLVNFAKNIIKKLIGRQVTLSIPYTSKYRSLLIRTRIA